MTAATEKGGSFFRIATGFPPPDEDYLTAREKGRQLRRSLSPELQAAYDHGLSCFDTAEAAVQQAVLARGRLGLLIVRYDILTSPALLRSSRSEWPFPMDDAKGLQAMIHDLWDVEAGFYYGRFETEDAALEMVRELLDANGDDYADVLELGTPFDPSGERSRTGPALVERARRPERIA